MHEREPLVTTKAFSVGYLISVALAGVVALAAYDFGKQHALKNATVKEVRARIVNPPTDPRLDSLLAGEAFGLRCYLRKED